MYAPTCSIHQTDHRSNQGQSMIAVGVAGPGAASAARPTALALAQSLKDPAPHQAGDGQRTAHMPY